MPKPFISIIIPAYNEAQRLPETLVLIKSYLEEKDFTAEVLVVDDASQDETVATVQSMQKRFKQLKVVENKVNKGKGGVVKQGMILAEGDWRLFIDADNSTPIQELDKFLLVTKGEAVTVGAVRRSAPDKALISHELPEVVIGSRYLRSDSIKIKQPWKRRLLSRVSNWFIQRTVLPGIRDTQCGFKLFSAKATSEIFPQLTLTGWAFDVELLTIARYLGYNIYEVPVDWFDARRSKLRAIKAISQSSRDLWRVWLKVRRHQYSR